MSDLILRRLERKWQESGDPSDGALLLREMIRADLLLEDHVRAAAYLEDTSALAYFSGGLYDTTGKVNDHITSICPCSWCRWDEGIGRWFTGLLEQMNPLPVRNEHLTARDELLVRMGIALGEAVWKHIGPPRNERYFAAIDCAKAFLTNPSEDSEAACRKLWEHPDWGDMLAGEAWMHQILYFIVEKHAPNSAMHFFIHSGRQLSPPCVLCGRDYKYPIEPIWMDLTQSDEDREECNTCKPGLATNWRTSAYALEAIKPSLTKWLLTPRSKLG